MVLEDGDYIVGFWFVARTDGKGDWMASVSRKKGTKSFIIETRFRSYASEHPFDTNDKKRWFGFTTPENEPEDDLIAKMNLMAVGLESFGYGKQDKSSPLLIQSDNYKTVLVKLMDGPSWMNMKMDRQAANEPLPGS